MTGIEEAVWRDDWLYLAHGGMVAWQDVPAPVDVVAHRACTSAAGVGWSASPPEFNVGCARRRRTGFFRTPKVCADYREGVGSWSEQVLRRARTCGLCGGSVQSTRRPINRRAYDPLTTKFHAV
jgi:xylan 1,4-beta-xylosidase